MENDGDALNFKGSYMRSVHDEDHLFELACKFLLAVDFDTVVGTGMSGTIAAIKLAKMMGKRYLAVRKPNDGSHSSQPAEGSLGKRWIFVDDLISSGATFARVWNKIESFDFDTEFVGAFLYGSADDWYEPDWMLAAEMSEAGYKCPAYQEVIDRIKGRYEELVEELPQVELTDVASWDVALKTSQSMLDEMLYGPKKIEMPPNPLLPIPKSVNKEGLLMELYKGTPLRSILPDNMYVSNT